MRFEVPVSPTGLYGSRSHLRVATFMAELDPVLTPREKADSTTSSVCFNLLFCLPPEPVTVGAAEL